MTSEPFVPDSFDPPHGVADPRFVLEPLGPQHNDRDYAAWTSSIEHIRATPGWEGRSWPHPMTLDENRADLERHQQEFTDRTAFTYTVLDPADGDVIGCLYIYPPKDEPGVRVSSWVRADRAHLDVPLADAVAGWLRTAWPFAQVRYMGRPGQSR